MEENQNDDIIMALLINQILTIKRIKFPSFNKFRPIVSEIYAEKAGHTD